jgi:CheY-like chemotaxis protein
MEEFSSQAVILYVEDDEVDQMLFIKAVEKTGYGLSVHLCNNGEEGLTYLENHLNFPPMIIVSDINMPKMNGIELAKKIEEREDLRKKAIPFIFISTSSAGFDIDKAFELRVQGYFNKSHSIDKLNEDIHAILNYWKRSMKPSSNNNPSIP